VFPDPLFHLRVLKFRKNIKHNRRKAGGLMKQIGFDFNNMFDMNVGSVHGVTKEELSALKPVLKQAHRHFHGLLLDEDTRQRLSLEWVTLPFQSPETIRGIKKLADEIAADYENVIFLGIGGSYLGLKAAQDALLPAYYNEFESLRKGRPRIYFEGNNLDPDTLSVLLKSLKPKKTFCVVISKSGETTETKAGLALVEDWLKKGVGKNYGRQIVAITDPVQGNLRKKVNAAQMKDAQSFRNLPLLKGVGGRFSELNMGLLHLAVAGVALDDFLKGAAAMSARSASDDCMKNPALLYAGLQNILYRHKGKSIAIMMPFSETLKSTGDWYSQLLAESLGKKFSRRIVFDARGKEMWESDTGCVVNVGRTPVASRGTNDLHSIQQNNMEGQFDKTVTFIRVENFASDLAVVGTGDFLSGKKFSKLLNIAQEATEWALVKESRPNCAVIMPRVSAFYWGQLLFFFEMATAYEGELLNVNAFDQPGVEGYKNYMYFKLEKPGLDEKIAADIRRKPLIKKTAYIL